MAVQVPLWAAILVSIVTLIAGVSVTVLIMEHFNRNRPAPPAPLAVVPTDSAQQARQERNVALIEKWRNAPDPGNKLEELAKEKKP